MSKVRHFLLNEWYHLWVDENWVEVGNPLHWKDVKR